MSKIDGVKFSNVELPVDGGINLVMDAHKLEDNEFQVLENFEVVGGRLIQRNGIKLRSQAAFNTKSVRLLGYIVDPSTATIAIVAAITTNGIATDKLYYSTDGCTTWTELQFTGPTSFNCRAYRAITYGATNTMFIGTDVDLYQWTGSGVATVANTVDGFIGDIVLDRLFLFLDRTVKYSDPGNFTSFPAANTFSLYDGGTKSAITALVSYKDRLVVFRDNDVYILFLTGTPSNWSLKQFMEGVGCTGIHAVTMVDDWIYFIGAKGVYRTNLSTVEELSVSFRNIFDTRTSSGQDSAGKQPHGMWDSIGYYNNRLICNINIGGVENNDSRLHRMFVYNTVEEAWSEWKPNIASLDGNNYKTFFNMLAVDKTRISTADEAFPIGLYFGSGEEDGRTYMYNEDQPANDESGNFDCIAKSKQFTLDSSLSYKKVPFLNALVKGDALHKMEIKHVVNSVESAGIDFAAAGDLSAVAKSVKIRGPGYCNTYGYRIRATVPTGTATSRAELIAVGAALRMPRPVQVRFKD